MIVRPFRALRDADITGADVVPAQPSFEEFFGAEHARLFGALCLVTRDRHEAEDIMQEAFLRVWERWDRVSAFDDPSAYLFRTAMNVFRSRYRRAALAIRRTMDPEPREDALATIEDRNVVAGALKDLTADQRAAVVLTSYIGLTSEEAGRVMGMKSGAVRTLASRARAAIRERAGELT
jgi:RNA polymerase sigma-70 factor (ECF subfamily)